MTSGWYRQMDLRSTFAGMPGVAMVLRRIIDVDPDSGHRDTCPHLAALGALTVSSDHTLVRLNDLPVWDVNGYYRALGIVWPYRPSKKELREAYLRVDRHNDDYATFALKQLLDKDFRAFYDRRAIGHPVDDIYRWLALFRLAAAWAAQESQQTGSLRVASDFVPRDLQDEMADDQDQEPVRLLSYAPSSDGSWPFGYYLWDTRHRDDLTLSIWQRQLMEALWDRGLRMQFAVGYVGLPLSATLTAAVRYRLSHPDVEAILLGVGHRPTPELAVAVVATYHTDPVLHVAEHLHIPESTESFPAEPAHTGAIR